MLFSKGNKGTNMAQLYGTAATIGMHMVSSIIVGLVIGYYLDRYFDTKPWLLMIFFLLGVAAGFKMVWQDFKLVQKRAAREQEASSLKQDGEKGVESDESRD